MNGYLNQGVAWRVPGDTRALPRKPSTQSFHVLIYSHTVYIDSEKRIVYVLNILITLGRRCNNVDSEDDILSHELGV